MGKQATDLTDVSDLQAVYTALNRAQAVIEFELDGTVIKANQKFLDLFGYTQEEIIGQSHAIFCKPDYAASSEYREFWEQLGRGDFACAEFKRVTKDGSEVWLRASYNPVFGADGKPSKVVKFATDITAEKRQSAKFDSIVKALDRSQAVCEFELDGTISDANSLFLNLMGYDKDEVVGKHHRIFCSPSYAESPDYEEFWQKLRKGKPMTGEFKRVSKDGYEVWLQASYNPIHNEDGEIVQILKFATDITQEVQNRSLAMLEMSTPVAKIWDGVLFAPIVGIVDSRRSGDIMNKALSSIVDNRAHTLMLDISGVAVVDTAVANHLIKIAKAAVLMGCKTIISGISPAIAQTITELGIELGTVQTTSTIESALREAIRN
ncbi:MAG: PAS domain S-box protein [Halieaceae bacterium]|jgi:methyl-accepting chemotaxis protein|nr:PAS domain S-box protein [Halieaceae bacterium]